MLEHDPQVRDNGYTVATFKATVEKLIDRVSSTPTGERSRWQGLAGKATAAIKAHPIAAVAVGVGLGHLAMRMVRR